MSRHIAHDNTTVAAGGGGRALPDGTKVLARIVPTRKDGTSIEEVTYSKEGPNSTIPTLNIRFEASRENTLGAGRNFFARVPLARKLNTDGGGKYPDGVPAFNFFGLTRALGLDPDDPNGLDFPDDRDLFGREVELVLGVEAKRDLEAGADPNDLANCENTVKFINEANGVPKNPVAAQRTDTRAPGGYTPPGVNRNPQQQQQQAQQPGWTPPGVAQQQQQQQPPAQQQVQQQPPQQQAGWTPPQAQQQPQGGPWTPAPADQAYAQQVAEQGSQQQPYATAGGY